MGTTKQADVIVVGGGPAGQMAAIAAAEQGLSVILCEQSDRLGAKLALTGGGRCNLTNMQPPADFTHRFRNHGRYIRTALNALDQNKLRTFFADLGVPTHTPDDFHVFPVSNKASDICSALTNKLTGSGVRLLTRTRVTRVDIANNSVQGVGAGDTDFQAPVVIIATGGLSYPQLGCHGDGYTIAKSVGHTVIEPVPALVGLTTQEIWPSQCTGVTIDPVTITVIVPGQKSLTQRSQSMLFTHRGISGPCVLNISGVVSRLLKTNSSVTIKIHFFHGIDQDEWHKRFTLWQQTHGSQTVPALIAPAIPASVARALCSTLGLHNTRAADLSRAMRNRLIALLVEGVPLTINGTEGFSQAMVTAGGVALEQLDKNTLQSTTVKGLFFAGEVLDIDGPCGGYNLQWAFSSGYLAGRSVSH